MEVKKGYKQTEVGVIPEDWEVKLLEEVVFFTNGKAHEQFIDKNGDYVVVNSKFISTNGKVSKNSSVNLCPLNAGDITMVMSDIPNGRALAKCYIIPKGEKYALNQRICSLQSDKRRYKFLSYILNRNKYYLAFDSGTGQTNLKKSDVLRCPIPLPPTLIEQTSIATALTDADTLIQSLEKLIAKKRAIKQGTMHELLKPKEGWVVKKLGEVADSNIKWSFSGGPFGSNLKSSDYTEEGIRIIQLQNIGDGSFINDSTVYTSATKADELISCNIYPEEIILSKMGDPVARACIIPNFHDRYLMCSDGIRLSVDKNEYNPYFIYTYINSPIFRILADNASTGSTRKRIGLNELRNLELTVPHLLQQTHIATILSDMGAEIAALETKLTKYKQIKQGMMQNLLNGRIRLI